ncbi:MAG: pyruvate kinase [Desulfococcaceae bacterium]
MKKTKIVCTIGPASGSREVLKALIESGMDVARLNFSHGTYEEHREKVRLIRALSEELDRPVAILQDLRGPKIRVGAIPEPGIRLEPGQKFILTTRDIEGSSEGVMVSYPELARDVKAGERILLADGLMELVVRDTSDTDIISEVIIGGDLTSHKGINLPSGTVSVAAITEKDREDLQFGLENDVDYVALSFVRRPEDILDLKEMIRTAGKDIPVIAKIEKHEALEHVEEILSASDGVMVARGDLGVEIPLEQVPAIQKMLVETANAMGRPVIIATQMLRSMVSAPRPTRAEATDVANAVLDGADAVMLSEETASGHFPVEAVRFMVRIIENVEEHFPHARYLALPMGTNVSESVAHASCALADHLNAKAIVATTRSGFTATQISRFRPRPTLIALSPERKTIRRLALYWGCIPSYVEETRNTDERLEKAAISAIGTGNVNRGDLVVLTTGHPVWAAGTTNMLRVKEL